MTQLLTQSVIIANTEGNRNNPPIIPPASPWVEFEKDNNRMSDACAMQQPAVPSEATFLTALVGNRHIHFHDEGTGPVHDCWKMVSSSGMQVTHFVISCKPITRVNG